MANPLDRFPSATISSGVHRLSVAPERWEAAVALVAQAADRVVLYAGHAPRAGLLGERDILRDFGLQDRTLVIEPSPEKLFGPPVPAAEVNREHEEVIRDFPGFRIVAGVDVELLSRFLRGH
jgi:hypothetical protein